MFVGIYNIIIYNFFLENQKLFLAYLNTLDLDKNPQNQL